MRYALIIAGLLIAAAGVGCLLGKFTYQKDNEVMKLGGFSATVQTREVVPQWIGGVAVLLGGGLIAVGFTRKS